MRTEAEWRNDAISQGRVYGSFNNRRKREARSPTQLYNILSIEIGLSASTLASFYRHQKSPRRTSMDKIIEWVEKEGNKKSVSFSDNSSSKNSSSSGSVRGSISKGRSGVHDAQQTSGETPGLVKGRSGVHDAQQTSGETPGLIKGRSGVHDAQQTKWGDSGPCKRTKRSSRCTADKDEAEFTMHSRQSGETPGLVKGRSGVHDAQQTSEETPGLVKGRSGVHDAQI
ncbi:uncharacterized protein OCT59_024782 [Rhizophagus irregularis]|uniref:uncharacterized protein n=1 Tax=Rhizophagus irregularis TaxID=588596 RepID=UPI00332051DF|nr:hypothetical protein OCT59_024782 [Rhizophagus irregularis]